MNDETVAKRKSEVPMSAAANAMAYLRPSHLISMRKAPRMVAVTCGGAKKSQPQRADEEAQLEKVELRRRSWQRRKVTYTWQVHDHVAVVWRNVSVLLGYREREESERERQLTFGTSRRGRRSCRCPWRAG